MLAFRKIFSVFLLFCGFVFAQESAISEFDRENNRIFELLADNVKSLDYKTIHASGNATLISQDIYIMADSIYYNSESREAEIQGNARFYKAGNLHFSTQNAKVKFDSRHYIVEPFYMQDSQSGVWISAKFAESKGDEYEFSDIVVSGCDIGSPLWRIEGTSGSFNSQSEMASIWNPRIYIKDIPIFYLPYMFLPTKSKRASGLLYPKFTQSNLEGFVYIQPIFVATHDFWDMTISPQIRTSRGYGGNVELRFVDSLNKLFFFNMGFFNNFNRYIRRLTEGDSTIKNKTIYGFNFNHERRGILSEFFEGYNDGLYLDFRFMNDLDYIRLQDAKNDEIENRIQTSKANFFGGKDEHYAGLYFKYFLDLQSPTNNDTFHTLPHFQYHKSTSHIAGIQNFIYSIDVNSKNIMRYKGFGYLDNSIRIPFYAHLPIFAEYITVGASASLNAGIITLNRTSDIDSHLKGKNSTYFSANYGLFASSDIAKHYDKFFHALSFKAEFQSNLYSYTDDENNIFTPTLARGALGAVFSENSVYSETRPFVQLSFSQYFFGMDGAEIFYHRMFQNINTNERETARRFDDLRNEIGFSPIEYLSLSNTLYYSHKLKTISEVSFSLNAKYGYFRSSLTYYLKQKASNEASIRCLNYSCVETTANFLRVKMAYDFEYFSLYGDVGYDFAKKYLRDWNLVISKDIRCFGIGLKFANEITPVLTTTGSRAVTNRYISLEFRFVPVTSVSISHKFKESF